MKYSGIDLHSNNSVVVVSDEADRVLVRRRVPNDAAAILALLEGHREELVGVVVESTYNWYWLVDAPQAAGTGCVWRTQGQSNATRDSSTAVTRTMRRTWRSSCGWRSCRAVISARRPRVRCGIWHASACSTNLSEIVRNHVHRC
jgi:hypothetical protein